MSTHHTSKRFGVVLIPAYNSQGYLDVLLPGVAEALQDLRAWRFEIIVVDDGSLPHLAVASPESLRVRLLRNEHNQGKGSALKKGFQYLRRQAPAQPEIIITLDSDLQHRPGDLPRFVEKYQTTGADVLYGCRPRKIGQMPFHRILSNSLTSLIISVMIGRRVADSQCGFRLYRMKLLEQLPLQEERFHLESEILLRAGWAGARFEEVVIPTIYNQAPSAIRNLPDTWNFVSLILRLGWKRMFGHV